ncbi:MAG: PepSY domain-containing protein [Spirochaetes bacterium]|nr:PepSY domain-containing protein [Spirochaetota bacterium]
MMINRWHRRIAIASALVLASTAITGILWAYAPHLYFKDGYLQKKDAAPAKPLTAVNVEIGEALTTATNTFKTAKGLQSAVLRAEAGGLYYEVQRKEGKEQSSVLIDAVSGEVVSPLSEALATQFAAQYVAGNPPVKKADALTDYKHRSGKKIKSVYRIAFSAPGSPEIYIDRNAGQIVEESDNARGFHFWVMKIHQLQFFGTKKELTIIPGLALVLLIVTGTLLWLRRYRAA